MKDIGWIYSDKRCKVKFPIPRGSPPNHQTAIVEIDGFEIAVFGGVNKPGWDWEHVVVNRPVRPATYQDMERIRNLFFDDDKPVFQFHPRKEEYVNINLQALHMWRPLNIEIPVPPIYGGPESTGTDEKQRFADVSWMDELKIGDNKYRIPPPIQGAPFHVIVTTKKEKGWSYVEVAIEGEDRSPTWSEMAQLRKVFLGESATSMQVMPPVATVTPGKTLTLCIPNSRDIPLPPLEMVAPKVTHGAAGGKIVATVNRPGGGGGGGRT